MLDRHDMTSMILPHLERLGDPRAHAHAATLARRLWLADRADHIPRLALIDPERIDPEIGVTTTNCEETW